MSRSSRALLGAAILVHLFMLVSWRTGTLNPLFFDATVTHGQRGWDFYALYQAGHNVLTGHSVYESDGARIDMVIPGGTYTPFRYLPVAAYTVGVLLNLVPPLWAYRLWVALTEGCLLLCIALTWRLVRDPARRARLAAMWLCYSPYYLEIYMGQFSFVQATLLFATLLAALYGHLGAAMSAPWIASVLWKQNTALLAPVLARLRRWRALATLVLLLLLTNAPYFALVPGSLAAFARNFAADAPWFQMGNLGFRQLVFDALWSAGDVLGLEIGPAAHAWAQRAALSLFMFLPLALLLLDRRPDAVLHMSLWMTAYFLVYHHVWEHHYVMLLPVLVILSVRAAMRNVAHAATRHAELALGVLYLLLALPTPYALIDPQGQAAALEAMRVTPIRPLWQDLAYHGAKAIPALLLYLGLAARIAAPVVREWRAGRVTLWPLVVPDGGEERR
jgi:hypothetical protein